VAFDGWAVTFGTARRGLGGAAAHPLTASVPVTVLLYNGPLLCGFNVPVKGLTVIGILVLANAFAAFGYS